MTDTIKSEDKCLKCGGELQIRRVDYFTKKGIIMLTILGGLLTAGFYYLIFSSDFHSSGTGKLIVFGTIAIFTLIYKIGNKQQEILACPHC